MTGYTVTGTTKTTYNDPTRGIVNGVVVSFRMDAYNEHGEVRVPEMSAQAIKTAIEKYVVERDSLAGVVPVE